MHTVIQLISFFVSFRFYPSACLFVAASPLTRAMQMSQKNNIIDAFAFSVAARHPVTLPTTELKTWQICSCRASDAFHVNINSYDKRKPMNWHRWSFLLHYMQPICELIFRLLCALLCSTSRISFFFWKCYLFSLQILKLFYGKWHNESVLSVIRNTVRVESKIQSGISF